MEALLDSHRSMQPSPQIEAASNGGSCHLRGGTWSPFPSQRGASFTTSSPFIEEAQKNAGLWAGLT